MTEMFTTIIREWKIHLIRFTVLFSVPKIHNIQQHLTNNLWTESNSACMDNPRRCDNRL